MKPNRNRLTAVRQQLFTPVLAPAVQNRWLLLLLGAVIVVQVVVAAMATAWQCPIKSTLGIACPGCGLTRAMVLLVQGKWLDAVHLHAFAPIAVVVGGLLIMGVLLPKTLRHRAAKTLAAFERRSGAVIWLMLSMMIYWICRLMMFNTIH